MTDADKWKEFLRWWEKNGMYLQSEDIDEAVWKIDKKIEELQKGDNAKQ